MDTLIDFIEKCHDNLLNDKRHEYALNYLKKRGLKEKTIKLHKIGYCYYHQYLPKEICSFGQDENQEKIKDFRYFMRDRIIVPIYDEFGLLIAFATRKPSFEKGNTWWNLPYPFKKNNHLFMLDKTRKNIFDSNKVHIVEGYIDAIILHQEGVKNVVGLMGTVLSVRKIGLLARYCDHICLSMDMDDNKSGQKASVKSLCLLKELDFYENVSAMVDLPIGTDPDEFILEKGKDAFLKLEKNFSMEEIEGIYKKYKKNKR